MTPSRRSSAGSVRPSPAPPTIPALTHPPGFTPCDVTYSSDNFDKLYDLAEKLILLGKAYVCHCNEDEIKLQRGGKEGKEGPRFRCAHAETAPEESLRKFRDMRDGKYEPRTAFLRMKQDIESGNPCMWDVAAYRIPKNKTPHHRAPEWKMFPTYDFTHCLCDSFERVTHSMCTTEFILQREAYDWLIRELDVYAPQQREFGRFCVSGCASAWADGKQVASMLLGPS